MRSDFNHSGYVLRDTTDNEQIDGTFVDGKYHVTDADPSFGYGAMIGWRFANTGNDMHLNYFNTENDDSDTTTRGGEGVNLHTVGGINNDFWFLDGGTAIDKASGKNELSLSAIDFELGQHIDVGCHTSMRFFVGISRHDLEKETKHSYYGVRPVDAQPDQVLTEDVDQQTEFKGLGPRFGIDSQYAFNNGFGLVGHFSAALLYGKMDSKTRAIQRNAPVGSPQQESGNGVSVTDRRIVIPNLELKLGVDYSYCFNGGSIVTAELGYWGKTYLGGLNDTAINYPQHASQVDNITFHGGYLSLTTHL